MRVAVINVDQVDDASQSFTANVFFEASWIDTRLAHDTEGTIRLSLIDIWHPELLLINRQRIVLTLPKVAQVSPEGVVTIRQRVWGDFSQPLDLHDFPFDTQKFEIWIASAQYPPSEVVLVQDPNLPSLMAPRFSLPDWTIEDFDTLTRVYGLAENAPGRSSFVASLTATRKTGYYLIKVILPFILIVMMSWIVFWIDPEHLGTQIGMAATSMLTLIAYRFAVDQLIPAVSYLTRLDRFILVSTLLVFTSLGEGVLTAWLNNNQRRELALKVDSWFRILSPFALVVLAVWAFAL